MTGLVFKNLSRGNRITLALVLGVIALGIFFRFYRIDQRLFWQDEVFMVSRLSGYTERDMGRDIRNSQAHSFQDLDKFLHPAKHSKSFPAVINTAWEYPHIPPLYESLLWCWIRVFGDSIVAIRSFSAFLSLFAFPLVIWLCWELFRSYKVGWIAAALIAVSPYQVYYAQEARNYSLWCIAILLSSAALLRAVRLGSAKAWVLYVGSLVLGLYAHTFFHFVAVAHVIYVFLLERSSIKKIVFSGLAGLLFFSPQLYLMIRYFKRLIAVSAWVSEPVSDGTLVQRFCRGLAALFVEPQMVVNFTRKLDLDSIASLAKIALPYTLVLFAALMLLYIWKWASRKQSMFVLAIFALNFLGLLLPDLLMSGFRVAVSRYLMASFLMIQIGLAFFVCDLIGAGSRIRKISGYALLAAIFLAGAASCAWRSKQEPTDFLHQDLAYKEVAKYLDSHEGSLMVRVGQTRDLRKIFIVYYYLKNRETSFFTHLSMETPFSVDLDRHHKVLLTTSTRPTPKNKIRRWVESSGEYKLEPVGPKHWQSGRERIYEIRKAYDAK